MKDRDAPLAERFSPAMLVVVAILLFAYGFKLQAVLAPPVLALFLIYFLLPHRRHQWVFRTLVVVAAALLLWTISRFAWLLLILGVSMFIAYVLDPAVDALERKNVRRSLGIVLLLVPVMGLLALGGALLVPPLVEQLRQILAALPELAANTETAVRGALLRLNLGDLVDRYSEYLPQAIEKANEVLGAALGGLVGATRMAGSILAAVVIVPFCTFFFLRDYDHVREKGEELIPRKYHGWITAVSGEMNRLLGRWLRGVATVAVVVGVLTGFGLWLLGVPYALVLGVLAGLMNLVPVVGFWISFVAAGLVALSSVGWIALAKVGALFLVVSLIENQILQPRIVGEAVGLHPVVVLLALVFFADLLGVFGALVAVPLAMLGAILARELRRAYLASDLYREESPTREG